MNENGFRLGETVLHDSDEIEDGENTRGVEDTGNWTFAKRLILHRRLRGLTQDKLASDIGVSKDTIASWETMRKNPSRKNIRLLARYFDVTEGYMEGKEEFPTNADDSNFTIWGGSNEQLAAEFALEFDKLSIESRLEVMALITDLREREDRHKGYKVEEKVSEYRTKSKKKKEEYRKELWEQHIDEELRPPREEKAQK